MTADLSTIRQPEITPQDAPSRWIPGDQLGVSARHASRLFDKLKRLGAAQKVAGVRVFDRNHPDVQKRLRKATADRSYEADALSPYTQKQISAARKWVKIIQASQREIPSCMSRMGKGRTLAVEWFCKQRAPELGYGTIAVSTFKSRVARYDKGGAYKLLSQIDTRGRKTGSVVTCSDEAWSYFLDLYLDERRRSVVLCYELTEHEAKRRGWSWPAQRTIERRVQNDILEMTRILEREGEGAFKAKCLPRIRRDYSDVPAGDVWCADESTLDFYCQVPDGKGGLKRGRAILTAWLDTRSRMFVGWHIGHRANSDTIVASFKMGVQAYGPPVAIHCDNGADYKATAGRRKKKWSSFDQDRLINIYGERSIQVHWAIPYEPQAKMIESHFRAVHSRFDKLFDSYCGGSPETRPDAAMKIPVHKLPTLDDAREAFGEWLTAHHARPQRGDGMYNLSPTQAMEQFRGESVRILGATRLALSCGAIYVFLRWVRFVKKHFVVSSASVTAS